MAIVGHSRLVIITNVIYYFNNLQVCAIEMGSVTRSGKGVRLSSVYAELGKLYRDFANPFLLAVASYD